MEVVKCELDRKVKSELNIHTNCFSCLTNISADNPEIKCEDALSPPIQKPKRFSLRSICRYLNIKLTNDLIVNTDNLSVTLCKKCASVSSRLSDLCMELELLQMKVDQSLQIFFDTMKESKLGIDQVQIQGYQSILKGPVEDVKGNLIQDFRKMIKEKCHLRLNSVLPKVLIQESPRKCAKSPIFYPLFQTPLQAPSLVHNNIDMDKKSEDHEDNTSIVPEQEKALPSSSDYDDLPNQIKSPFKSPPKNKTGNKKLQTCTICTPHAIFPIAALRKHRIRVHLDDLLRDYKSPNISQNKFKLYCAHVFKIEAISCRRARNERGSFVCHCTYCETTMTPEFLKVHFYCKHKEILAKKLVELQKSTTVKELTAIKLPGVTFGSTQKCEMCGVICYGLSSLGKHKRFHCKFGPGDLTDKNLKRNHGHNECEVCGKVYKDPSNLLRHRNMAHRLTPKKKVTASIRHDLGMETPGISIELEGEGHKDDLSYHSGSLEFEDVIGSEEMDTQQHQMDVKIEKDAVLVKMEQFDINTEMIIPENDPLQF